MFNEPRCCASTADSCLPYDTFCRSVDLQYTSEWLFCPAGGPERARKKCQVTAEDHPLCAAAVLTSRAVFGRKPKIDKWTFSTNGVATMGLLGIPSVGFGPANEIHAHTVDDQVPVEHLWDRESFLEHTCEKAGLPRDTWKQPGVELFGFTATVFGEDD